MVTEYEKMKEFILYEGTEYAPNNYSFERRLNFGYNCVWLKPDSVFATNKNKLIKIHTLKQLIEYVDSFNGTVNSR